MRRFKGCILLLVLSLMASCRNMTTDTEGSQLSGDNQPGCIAPPQTFSYLTSGNEWGEFIEETIPPSEPWQVQADLPAYPDQASLNFRQDWILGVFTEGGESTVWILRSWADEGSYDEYDHMEILVYSTATEDWTSVPNNVVGIDGFVGEVFMTEDGSIWGHNFAYGHVLRMQTPYWSHISYDNNRVPEIPILSRYDAVANRFEPVAATFNIPVGDPDIWWDKVHLSQSSIFWFFIQGTGVYTFDPETEAIEQRYALDSRLIRVSSVTEAPDGSIFLSNDTSAIYRFDPASNEMENIGGTPLSFENPYSLFFRGILVGQNERIWVGNVGWAEPAGEFYNWYQFVPSPVFVTVQEGDTRQAIEKAVVLLESSDGRIWYQFSGGGVWLDPNHEIWCLFTTAETNIVEDQSHALWALAEGKLYRLDEVVPLSVMDE